MSEVEVYIWTPTTGKIGLHTSISTSLHTMVRRIMTAYPDAELDTNYGVTDALVNGELVGRLVSRNLNIEEKS